MAFVARLPAHRLKLPAECACCAAEAQHSVPLARQSSLNVGYCEACNRHRLAFGTRVFSVLLAQVVLALALAAALPLLFPWHNWILQLGLAIGSSLLPLVWLLAVRLQLHSPHSSVGRAAWLVGTELCCTNAAWATRCAQTMGLNFVEKRRVEPRVQLALGLGPLVALVAGYLLHGALYSLVRVINSAEKPGEVWVDGRFQGIVEPNAEESPFAGSVLNLPAGERQLEIRDLDGRVTFSQMVALHGGRAHLFAPGRRENCFWVESKSYGREAQKRVAELDESQNFWVLPDVQRWFVPLPSDSEWDKRWSGGTESALRQGPCSEVPR